MSAHCTTSKIFNIWRWMMNYATVSVFLNDFSNFKNHCCFSHIFVLLTVKEICHITPPSHPWVCLMNHMHLKHEESPATTGSLTFVTPVNTEKSVSTEIWEVPITFCVRRRVEKHKPPSRQTKATRVEKRKVQKNLKVLFAICWQGDTTDSWTAHKSIIE